MRIPGSWTIARPFGVPVRIHWSVPVCALLAGGLEVSPGAWLAYLLLVLIHEAGHAFVVRRVGGRATALDILGFGGLCWWDGEVTALGRACIAWGGIWAQMIVFAIVGVAVLLLGHPSSRFADQMIEVALTSNLWLMGINLLPIPPLDGKEAWTLFPLLRRRWFGPRVDASMLRSRDRSLPRATSISERAPAPRAVTRVRVIAPRLDRTEIARPTPGDDLEFDEASFTPEAEAVIERARAIAREAAQSPDREGPPDRDRGRGSA